MLLIGLRMALLGHFEFRVRDLPVTGQTQDFEDGALRSELVATMFLLSSRLVQEIDLDIAKDYQTCAETPIWDVASNS